MRYCEENKVQFKLNGSLIRQLRNERNLSQVELATDLCMQQYEISKIENGTGRHTKLNTVMMFADYFKVNIEKLILKINDK